MDLKQITRPGARGLGFKGVRVRPSIALSSCATFLVTIVSFALKPGGTPVSQLPPSELRLIDGRLCKSSSQEPFTGIMIERYPNRRLKSRSSLVNGKLEGLSQGWYANGQLQVRENFKAGISNGIREKFYENGARMSEARIVRGELHGVFRRWHQNGALAEEIPMENGSPRGLCRSWNPDGSTNLTVSIKPGDQLAGNGARRLARSQP